MDIRNFCTTRTTRTKESCQEEEDETPNEKRDKVSAAEPPKKRPRVHHIQPGLDLDASTPSCSNASSTTFTPTPRCIGDIEPQTAIFVDDDVDANLLGDRVNEPVNTNKHRVGVTPLGPADISKSPDDGPTQPGRNERFTFKKTHGRKFNPEWYKTHPWLEFSANSDKAYCFVCRHFVENVNEKAFTADGFNTWKKCTGESSKNNKLIKHKLSDCHVKSSCMYKGYLQTKRENKTVLDYIDKAHQHQTNRNREYIKILADTLRLTAIQNIAQRGHREHEESLHENRGNFLEILEFLKKYEIHERISESVGNAKYTHHTVQNAILDIFCDIILDEIKEEIGESQYFSILVDETKDLSKQEQMSFVIRYLFDGEIHEEFVGFRCAEGLDAESLAESIIDELNKIGIQIDNLIGQGYDGASVMSGHLSGVQERIRRKIPQALYVHCFAHRLNLVIVETVKSVVPVADFFAVLQQCYNFLSGSHVHSEWLKWQQNKYPNEQPVEFKGKSDTRWSSQVRAVTAIRKRFHCLVEFLRNIDTNDRNRERALNARSILTQLDQTFIYCMLFMDEILHATKGASDTLQNPKLDYLRAADLIEALLDELQEFRTNEKADDYFSQSHDMAVKSELKCSTKRRQANIPTRMENYAVLSKLGKRVNISDSATMRTEILLPTVDVFLAELNRRFSHENLRIFRSLGALDPKSNKFMDFDTAQGLASHYNLNLDDLKTEMRLAKRMIERTNVTLETTVDVVEHIKPLHLAFEELFKLLTIATVLPISTATCERSFSKLKLIKNHLRTSMGNERLKSLTVISVHRNRALSIDLDHVVERFILKYPNSRIMLK